MKKIITLLLSPIKDNSPFFFFMYLLGVLLIIIQTIWLNFRVPKFDFLSYIMDIYLICLFLLFVPVKQRRFVRSIITILLYALAIVNVFCIAFFNAKLGPEILNLILETDKRESSEFVSKYINMRIFYSPVVLILLLIISHALFCVFKKKNILCFNCCSLFKSSSVKYLFNTFISFCVIISFVICAQSRYNLLRLLFASSLSDAVTLVDNYTLNTPLNNMFFAIKMRNLANRDLGRLADNQDAFTIDSCTYTSDNIILIIGESYNRSHSQLYGYEKNTTPYQKMRADSGNLVVFQDVVSPSNLTSVVFRNAFSLHSIDDKTDWANFPLFPVLFRRAGYTVFFLTNQFVKSVKQDVFNFSGGLFLNVSRLSDSQFDRRNTSAHRFDGDMIIEFDSLKQYKGSHNLVIFHLAGQHIDFNKRCPDDVRKYFIPDYYHRKDLSDEERQIVADYDNATLYNDKVIELIIKQFENDDAIVIYMPDHGEECYDELHRMGRMPSGFFSAEMARQEYCIPFWVWCSKQYINNRPLLFFQICQAVNHPFMTDDLPHLLLYLGGIRTPFYKEDKNLISRDFDINRKRLIEGLVDFDSLVNKKTEIQ